MSAIFAPGSVFAQCHASTLAALPGGRLAAAWFGGTAERDPDTAIWGALFDGTTWSEPRRWFKICGEAHWNPVLFVAPDGRLHIWFKVGPEVPRWRSHRSVSDDGGATWAQAVPFIPEDALARGSVRCPLLVTRAGTWLAPGSEERVAGLHGGGWWPYIDRSEDAGRTWAIAPIRLPPKAGGIQPTLWESASGVHALMRSTTGEMLRSDSTDDGRTWCPAYGNGLPNNNSGIIVAPLADDHLLMLWNPVGKDWGPRTPLRLSRSRDDGRSWETIRDLATGEGEFSYPALVVADGLVSATWTDRRTTIGFWQGRV